MRVVTRRAVREQAVFAAAVAAVSAAPLGLVSLLGPGDPRWALCAGAMLAVGWAIAGVIALDSRVRLVTFAPGRVDGRSVNPEDHVLVIGDSDEVWVKVDTVPGRLRLWRAADIACARAFAQQIADASGLSVVDLCRPDGADVDDLAGAGERWARYVAQHVRSADRRRWPMGPVEPARPEDVTEAIDGVTFAFDQHTVRLDAHRLTYFQGSIPLDTVLEAFVHLPATPGWTGVLVLVATPQQVCAVCARSLPQDASLSGIRRCIAEQTWVAARIQEAADKARAGGSTSVPAELERLRAAC